MSKFHFLFCSIDEEILAMEQGQPRWTEGSALYQAALANNTARRKKSHLFKLHTLCVDRWLLISLKQKYAGINLALTVLYLIQYEFSS